MNETPQLPNSSTPQLPNSPTPRLLNSATPRLRDSLLILAISLVALWPFLSRASLPQGTDAELHIFRLAELSYLVRHGEIYPRWAPNFYYGYGYPIFNYYAPLTYYLGLLIELLPRLDAVAGVKAVFMLGLLLGAVGTYGYVRDHWGKPAGYVATAVFLYAPYVQYIDPHVRGALAESFSLGLFPLALWWLDRLRRHPTPWHWVTAVLAVAAVILSHNLMALLNFALLVAWAIWETLTHKRASQPPSRSALSLVYAALGLGLLLAAFFWLPVILERHAVTLTTLIGQGDHYDFRTHFLTWGDLFATTQRLDWGAAEPLFRFNLGTACWLLALVGLLTWPWGSGQRGRSGQRGPGQRWRLAFFVLALAGLLLMMLPISTPVWTAVPFLPYFQFPWRLMGAVALMLAILAGAGTAVLLTYTRARWQAGAVTAVFTLLPILFGLPLSQPPAWPDFGPVTQARITDIEHKGYWLGTTSTADYVPATVDMVPGPTLAMEQSLMQGQPVDRVNRAARPKTSLIDTEFVRPLLTRYHVTTPKPFRLRLYQFDFPGWQVRIDGQLVDTELALPEGFLVIPVPAGEHVVEVKFDSTPARTLAWGISGLALLVTAVLVIPLRRLAPPAPPPPPDQVAGAWPLLSSLALFALFALLLEPQGWLHLHSTGWTAVPAQTEIFADFGRQVALIGYDTDRQTPRYPLRLHPGDTLTISLYWKAQQPLDINYQSFVHLLAADGTLMAQSDHLNPGEFPTRRWDLTTYVLDTHHITLPPTLPPGQYTLATGLWVQAEGWRLPRLDAAGAQIGDNAVLLELVVEEANQE